MTKTTDAARTLAANLAARAIAIKHVQALDLVAAACGLANRHVLAKHDDLPLVRRANRALLSSAASVLAQHDLDRRQAIIDEAIKVVEPANPELIVLEEYGLSILPSELDDPETFFATERGQAFIASLTSDMYYTRYSTSQSDRPMSLSQGNELAEAILDVKRDTSIEDQPAAISRALAQHFGFGWSVGDYWWHEARRDVEKRLDQVNADLEDIDAELSIETDLWLDLLEDYVTDRLQAEDDSKPEDLLSRFDTCEMLFIFQKDGYVIDELISSNKSWADYADLHVGPELQFALSRLGYSLGEYRMLSGNRNEGHDLLHGLKKRPERLIEPDDLQSLVENACAQYFCFALYAIVPVQQVINLDLSRPVTFSQAAVATYNPFSGTFMDVIKKTPITVTPKEGRFQTGSEGYSPDGICGLVHECYAADLKNLTPAGAPRALAA